MQRLTLFTSLLAIFFLAWIGSRSLNADPLCLNSDSIIRLNYRFAEQGTSQVLVNSCGWREWFSIRRLPLSLVSGPISLSVLNKRIQRAEDLARSSGLNLKPLELVIDDTRPFVMRNFSNKVHVGGELARRGDALERSLFRRWMIENLGEPLKDGWSLEVLVDFWVLRLRNSYEPLKPFVDNHHWLASITSFRDYCLSDSKLPQHTQYCSYQNSLPHKKKSTEAGWLKSFDEPSLWAMQPLMSQVLYEYFSQLELRDRLRFLQSLSRRLNQGELPKVSLPKNYGSYSQLTSWFQKTAMKLIQFGAERIEIDAIAQSFERHQVESQLEVDLMIELTDQDFSLDVFESLMLWSQRQEHKSVLVADQNGYYIFPSARRVAVYPPSLEAKKHIVVSCQFPQLKRILDVKSDRFTVVKYCKDQPSPRWGRILQAGVNSFLSNHRNLQFITFHKPSLNVAVEKLPETMATVEGKSIHRMDLWMKALSWQSLEWDSAQKSYRPKGPVDAIEQFRIGKQKKDI